MGLASITALQTELTSLMLLADDRRKQLAATQKATMLIQATVHQLTMQLRQEEAVRIASCAATQTPQALAPNAASPGLSLVGAGAPGASTPGAGWTLLDWAKGFLAAAPPTVAADFQAFITGQQQKEA